MPSPYDRIRRQTQRRRRTRSRTPPPPSSISIIAQLFVHMYTWIEQVQARQTELDTAIEELRENAVDHRFSMRQRIMNLEERMEQEDLFPGRYPVHGSSSVSSLSSDSTATTWSCQCANGHIASAMFLADGPSTSSAPAPQYYCAICDPRTSSGIASEVTVTTSQMSFFDMDTQNVVQVPSQIPLPGGCLPPLPQLFPPTSSMLPPPPPPPLPQMPPPPPPPHLQDDDVAVHEYEVTLENGRTRDVTIWRSQLPQPNEYPDIVDPALISGPCSICMERAPAARVHWRPNVCGHLQVCDGCMAAGPDSTRVDIRAPGDWLTANNTVRSQFVYAHEQRPARRSTGVQCVQNGCDNVQCGHWQLLADGQEHGLECEVCKKYFGAYVREEHVPPPSRPSTPQA